MTQADQRLHLRVGDTPAGEGSFAGVRYASRLGDELTSWALFEPYDPIVTVAGDPVAADDSELLTVLERYGLQLEK